MQSTKLPDDFYLSLTEFLLQAKHQIVDLSGEFGLTSMQALTLLLIGSEQPRPMNALCKLFACDASNITGIIDGLEQKQLVSRQINPDDRRVKVIQLEPAGEKLRQQIATRLASQSDKLFSGLTAAETLQLVNLIQKVATGDK